MSDETSKSIAALSRPLRSGAIALEIYAIVNAIGGVVVGIALASHTEPTVRGEFVTSDTSTHPWVVAGIGLATGALLFGLFLWCVGRALHIYAEDTAARHGDPIWLPKARSKSVDPQEDEGVELVPGMRVINSYTGAAGTVEHADLSDSDYFYTRLDDTKVVSRVRGAALKVVPENSEASEGPGE